MAAGISPKRAYRLQYNHLQRIRRKLADHGIALAYKGLQLTDFDPLGKRVWYRHLRASNGESAFILTTIPESLKDLINGKG